MGLKVVSIFTNHKPKWGHFHSFHFSGPPLLNLTAGLPLPRKIHLLSSACSYVELQKFSRLHEVFDWASKRISLGFFTQLHPVIITCRSASLASWTILQR